MRSIATTSARSGWAALLVAAFLVLAGVPLDTASAQVSREFSPRFSTNTTGNIVLVGNTSSTCRSGDAGCAGLQNNFDQGPNNNFRNQYVDVDGGGNATVNSSSSTLNLPASATVLWAGLYWSGDKTSGIPRGSVKLDLPNTPGFVYQTIPAQQLDDNASYAYGGFAEITSLVQGAGNGSYTVADVSLGTNNFNRFGGWTIIVAYEDANDPLRNLTVTDGLVNVNNANQVTFETGGFTAPFAGPFETYTGVVATDGDWAGGGFSGDALEINGTPISNGVNPANNFFNSTISDLGNHVTARSPAHKNTLGYDSDRVLLPNGTIPNGATSATVRATTGGESYAVHALTFATDIYRPKVTTEKFVRDVNGGQTQPGDILEYTVVVKNTDFDPAVNIVLTDAMPANTTYVPGSLAIAYGANMGPISDASGDDQGEFLGGSDTARFRLGVGANSSQGGSLGRNEETAITFRVKVDNGLPDGTTIFNRAVIDYEEKTLGGRKVSTGSTATGVVGVGTDLAITKTDSVDPVDAGETFTYTITASNDGPDPATDVLISDVLPAEVEFVSASVTSGAGWTPTTPAVGSSSGTVKFAKSGAFAVNETASFTITVKAKANLVDGSFISNTARINATTPDINASNNADQETTQVRGLADLRLTKTATSATVGVGQNVTFTITVFNDGPNDATGVTVHDLLPAGLTFVSAAPAADYDEVAGLWTVGTVTSGNSDVLTITARVDQAGAITNVAQVASSDQVDPDSAPNNDTGHQNEDDEDAVTITGVEADLSLHKTVVPTTVLVGQNVTYTLTVSNIGPSDATGVEVTDPLPAGLTFVSADPAPAYDSGTGVWTVGAVANGGTKSLDIVATVTAPGAITNNAQITASDQPDPDSTPGNGNPSEDDQASATVGGTVIDLSLHKSVMPHTIQIGETASFTITVGNDGSADATGVAVSDVLPAGLTFVGANPALDYNSATGVWTIGDIPQNMSRTLVIEVRADADGSFTNTAQVAAANEPDADSTPANNTAGEDDQDDADLTVTPLADLRVTKTVDNSAPVVGSFVTYTITVFNDGPSDATGVALSDAFPYGVDYQSDVPSQGAYDSATGIWTVGALASGANATLEVTARITQPRTLTNVAQVSASDQPDPNSTPGNDDPTENDQASSSVGGTLIDLSLGKDVSVPAVNVGDDVTFTLTITNGGTADATGVEVTDQLPAGLTFVSANPAVDYSDATGIWDVGAVAIGQTKTLEIVATVTGVGPFDNEAEVTAANEPDVDSTPGNDDPHEDDQNNASVSGLQADLSLTKIADDTSPRVGDTVVYTITVTNDGPSASMGGGVSVGDQLPAGVTFASAVPSQGSYDVGNGVWMLGTLGVGQSATLLVEVRVDQSGALTNTAQVIGADEPDPDSIPNNNAPGEDDQDSAVLNATPQDADLSLIKTVDNPAPRVGDAVTFTVTVRNDGPGDATGVEVTDQLPAGLAFVSAVPAADYNAVTGVWTIGAIPAGTLASLQITATLTATGAIRNVAEVTASDNPDPDSIANNGDINEDDQDDALLTGGSSGGGGGGVESDGGMALLLNQRLFERRTDAFTQHAFRAAPAPVVFADAATASLLVGGARAKNGAAFDLARIAPEAGPMSSLAYVVTPEDILGVTNATSVFATDYVRQDGVRLGAFFATTSAIDLYDHTKQTCDRLGGGRLERVSTAMVAGNTFILSELHQASGEVDYAITFVAYRTGSTFAVDSRYVPDAYDVPNGVDEILNVQVWAASPEFAEVLAEDALARLSGHGSVSYLNAERSAPNVYVRSGRYEQGVLALDVANTTGAVQTLTITGTYTETETEAQANTRTAFEETITVGVPSEGDLSAAAYLRVGQVYDLAFTLESGDDVFDRSYAADGTWGTNVGAGQIEAFGVLADERDVPTGQQHFQVARSAFMQGRTSEYAALFRSLRPAWQPVDLSGMTHLEAMLSGQGRVQVVVEKASVEDGQQFGTELTLAAQPTRVRIALSDLTNASGQGGFAADDVTAIVFYATNDGSGSKPFTVIASDLVFTGNSAVATEEAWAETPTTVELASAYPNPFTTSTAIRYGMPETGHVHLGVYDLLGREVATLVDGVVPAGSHEVTFDSEGLAAGTYLYRLETETNVLTKTITLVR